MEKWSRWQNPMPLKLLAFYSFLPIVQTLHKMEFPWVYEFSQLLYLMFSLHLFSHDALLNLFLSISVLDVSSVQISHSFMSNFGDTMDCSMPGFPVHHQLLELTKTHVHRVSGAKQPSHSPSSFFHLQSFPASGSFPLSLFFTSGGQSIGVSASASVLLMNIQD